MTVNVKRIFSPLICVAAGLFNFVFMFLNYAKVFSSTGGQSESQAFNAYETLELANSLEELLNYFTKDSSATFLLSIVSALIIGMIVMGIGLLLVGCIGLVRECAGINLFVGMKPEAADRLTAVLMSGLIGIYGFFNVLSATFLIISCMINSYTVSLLGYKISFGLKPGIGMFLLLIFSLAELFALQNVQKKLLAQSQAAKTVYKCSACGEKATASNKFCASCGSPVVAVENVSSDEAVNTSSASTTAEASNDNIKNFDCSVITNFFKDALKRLKSFMKKNNISPKILYAIGGTAFLLIIAIIVLVNIPWPRAATYIVPEKSISYAYSVTDKQTVILSDGESTNSTVEGRIVLSAQALDGKTMAFLSDEDKLFVYCNDELITVGEQVENFKLSAEGTSVAYTNAENELILFTTADKNQKTITDDITLTNTSYYYLSPDGNSVAYVEGDVTDFALYVFSNEKKNEIEENALPLGLSDNAELVYYYSTEKDSVYVQNKDGSPVRLINGNSDLYGSVSLKYNAEHTQILFCYGSNWYISDNGQEKQKISSQSIRQFGDVPVNNRENIVTTPIIDFKEQYFIDSSNTLYYINGKFEAIEVASSVSSFKTTADLSTVYYLDENGELYRGEGYGKEFKMIAEDVSYFEITSDGKKCYYVDYDDTLRYLKKANKSKKIADDVEILCITHDDYAIFMTDYAYANGGTLYFTYNGKEKEHISDDVLKVDVTATSTYYYRSTEEEGIFDVFGAVKKAEFSMITEEVSN